MKGFKNVNAYLYGKGIVKTNVGFENGIITYVGNDDVITEEIEVKGKRGKVKKELKHNKKESKL